MSWGTCYSASNNIHPDYPALMSDGNIYTNYNSDCNINRQIIQKENIKSNFEYRKFLTNNAKKIMNVNRKEACNMCGVCHYGYPLQMNHGKYLYRSIQDGTQPYGYETSDLKREYLSRQQLQSRLVAPILSQNKLLSYPRHN